MSLKETFHTLHTNAHERENATKSKGEIQIYKADLFKFFIKKKIAFIQYIKCILTCGTGFFFFY